jgi:hypothetical protein
MTTCDHIVYGSDSGAPGVTEEILEGKLQEQIQNISRNALNLFPLASARIEKAANK